MAQPRKLQDKFFKMAKEDGYAARSAYKLEEINRRKRVLKRGDLVLDLGCSPGSWMQVASEIVGPDGFVLGLDLKPVTIPGLANGRTLVMDVFKATGEGLLRDAGLAPPPPPQPSPSTSSPSSGTSDSTVSSTNEPPSSSSHRISQQRQGSRSRTRFDTVLSDMAPNTEGGGGRTTDHFRSVELCRRVLQLLPNVLRPGGNVVMKVFEGEAYPALVQEVAAVFGEAKGFKPAASRDVSREMFIIGIGYEPALRAMKSKPPPGIAPAAPAPRAGWGQNTPDEPDRRTSQGSRR